MSEINFYIKKLQDLEYRGEWKEIYSHSFEKIHAVLNHSHYLRRNYYLQELEKFHEVIIDLPFTPDDEEKLIFRKTQKHIIDLLYQVREENKKIFIAHGRDSSFADKVSALLGRLRLDYQSIDYGLKKERNVKEFNSIAKEYDFAIIVMSADDIGTPLGSGNTEGQPRSSQNVIFQFGYFLSHVGRKNLVLLYPDNKTLEFPIDLDDLKHSSLDAEGKWKSFLTGRLSEAGIFLDEDLLKGII